ncbi:hypothetical protein [Shinella sp.]|uniref:hypothetical protein n=1 Tax=Shinella sp. TaxID=1870904 RepID=UPI003D26A088
MPLATDLVMMGIPTQQAELLGYGDQNPLDGSGTAQVGATPIPMYTTNVAMGTSVGDTAFILPAEVLFQWPYFLLNTTAEPALVYPPIGAAIDDNAVDAPITVIQDQAIQVVRIEDGRWVTWQTGRPPAPTVTASDVDFTPYPPITADNVQTAIEQVQDEVTALAGDISGFVPDTRQVNAGTGLDGGGALSTDITIDLDAATQASLALADSAVQPGDLGSAAYADTSDFATAAQGAKADSAAQLNVDQAWSKAQRAASATALSISGGTVTWNLADGNFRELSVTASFTLNLPSDIATHARQSGYIVLTNTGSFTMSVAAGIVPFNSASLFTIAPGSGAITVLTYLVNAAGTAMTISGGGWNVAL